MEPGDEISAQEIREALLHDNVVEESNGNVKAGSDASILETAVRVGGRGAAVLAKQLPTASTLVFLVFAPITTARGICHSSTRIETITLISICAISCIIPNFTDSFRDRRGNLHYGMATFTGLFVIDRTPPPPEQKKYRIRASDFLHAFNSLVIFMAVVLYSKEVLKCFFPGIPDDNAIRLIFALGPILIGIIGCILFLMYPSSRRGLGFPVGEVTTHD